MAKPSCLVNKNVIIAVGQFRLVEMGPPTIGNRTLDTVALPLVKTSEVIVEIVADVMTAAVMDAEVFKVGITAP